MAALNDTDFKQLVQNQSDFVKWFWTKSKDETLNGDQIIEYINSRAPETYRLRRLEMYIYGVIINSPKIEIKILDDSSTVTVKLMKVGFTMADTASTNKRNRVATVRDEVHRKLEKKYNIDASTAPIFVLSIYDPGVHANVVEKNIREKCGIALPKVICDALDLPVPTEWVVTTDNITAKIRKRIDDIKASKLRGASVVHDTTTVFKNLPLDAEKAKLQNVAKTLVTIEKQSSVPKEVSVSLPEGSKNFSLLPEKNSDVNEAGSSQAKSKAPDPKVKAEGSKDEASDTKVKGAGSKDKGAGPQVKDAGPKAKIKGKAKE